MNIFGYSGRGVTRQVVLVGRYALKFPRMNYGWSMFLRGLLGNMQEALWGRSSLKGFCPVVFTIPGGFLTVQRRVRLMTEAEFEAFDVEAFCVHADYHIPAERKRDSFGWLCGQVVAIDYADFA